LEIIAEKNYIDTLYLSTNLEYFVTDDDLHDAYKYVLMLSYISSSLLFDADCIGSSMGRDWYKLKNYTIGIMEYDKAKKSNQPNCVIQYDHSHIFSLNQQLDGLDLPFDGTFEDYMIKRIDITKTIKSPIDYTVGYGYLSPYRSSPLRPNRKDNTIYLGSRKNGNLFRMYPKTIELRETKNYKKIALYTSEFGDIEDLYTFEHELHRSYLKEDLGIDRLSELSKVWEASASIVCKILFFKDTDKNRKNVEHRNYKRIETVALTEYKEFERPTKKRYKRSYPALLKRLKKEIDSYLSSGEVENETAFWLELVTDLTLDVAKGKDLEIALTDTDRVLEYSEMEKKHNFLRETDDYLLQEEAKKAFG